jgi:hypothetical protein
MRLLPVSATEMVPSAAIASADGSSSWPGPVPSEPMLRLVVAVARSKTRMHARRWSRT